MLDQEALTQYAAMARLRWRMFVNGLRSIHGIRDLGATGIAWMIYSVFGLGLGTALCAAAYSLVSQRSWEYLPILFWITSLLWLTFSIFVTSFQEQSDLGILLRFPVRFGSYFLLHSISSLTEASTIAGSLCCLGIWLGIVIARPDLYLWAALSLFVFAVFNILLVRVVFAWIDRWLAQRKTREILGAVFMIFMVCLLVVNATWNQHRREKAKSHNPEAALRQSLAEYAPLLKTANQVQQWLPPGLSARALQEAVKQRPVDGVVSLNLLGLWAVLAGGALAGRLKAQYRGQNLSWAPMPDKAIGRRGGWTLGGSRPFSAVLEKELRSLMRSVPFLWAICVPLLFVLVLAGGMFHHGSSSDIKSFPYAFPLCVAYALLGFTGLFYNSLGAEGAGIQLLFLSPTPIRTVLLAKNLLHSILFVLVGFAAGALVCLRLGLPPFVVLADTYAWLAFALPCNLAAGIVLSLAVPYRINPGRITRPAGSQANTLPAALIQLGVLGVGALVFWACWSLNRRWLPVFIFLSLAAGAFFAWTRILRYSDDNANQRRESLIATIMATE